jgi:transcriptional regulator with XRE-family HTH domain
MILSPIQCRMARAALGMGVRELAAAAKVSVDTVARFERGDELKERTVDALQRALETAGIEFTNGDHPGVRLNRAAAARSAEAVQQAKRLMVARTAVARSQTAADPSGKKR